MLIGILFYALIWFWWRTRKQMRRIQDLPTSRAASVAQGPAELEGYVWPLEPQIESLAGKAVVQRQIRLEEYITGKNGGWTYVAHHHYSPNYVLVDDSGAVELSGVFGTHQQTWEWKALSSAERTRLTQQMMRGDGPDPAVLRQMADRFGDGKSPYRLEEQTLVAGEKVYAHGLFRTASGERREVTSPELIQFVQHTFGRAFTKILCHGSLRPAEGRAVFVRPGHQAEVLSEIKGRAVGLTMLFIMISVVWYSIQLIAKYFG